MTKRTKSRMPEYRVELYRNIHELKEVIGFKERQAAHSRCKDWIMRESSNRALLMTARRKLWTRRFVGYELESEYYGSAEALPETVDGS